jgi:hypothetical protein
MKFAIVLVAASILASTALAQSCGTASSCASCTAQPSCGWCTYSNTCESGNQTGSYVGCTAPYWSWTQNTCPATPAPTVNPCSGYTTCYTCAVASCGWCSFSGVCELGNVTGSFVGCTAPYWSWTQNSCPTTSAPTAVPTPVPNTPVPTASCSQYTNCNTCTVYGGCGWCAYTAQCEAGNVTGSFVGCVAPYWSWVTNQCPTAAPTPTPAPTVSCSSATSCFGCTQLSTCGWCSFTNLCEQGNATGSVQGCVSPYWSWTNAQCPATSAR